MFSESYFFRQQFYKPLHSKNDSAACSYVCDFSIPDLIGQLT